MLYNSFTLWLSFMLERRISIASVMSIAFFGEISMVDEFLLVSRFIESGYWSTTASLSSMLTKRHNQRTCFAESTRRRRLSLQTENLKAKRFLLKSKRIQLKNRYRSGFHRTHYYSCYLTSRISSQFCLGFQRIVIDVNVALDKIGFELIFSDSLR